MTSEDALLAAITMAFMSSSLKRKKGVPGAVINALSADYRSALQNLKSDDPAIRSPLKDFVWDEEIAALQQFRKDKLEFDQKLILASYKRSSRFRR